MNNSSLPLVSVIIPVYNSEKFLSETIESVIQQEYKNWEILLADDGSTDNSKSIAKRYADKYPLKIKYAEHKYNKGASATRNLAISIASGELVALLDSDDLWKPQYLRTQVEFLVLNPEVDVVNEATLYWYRWADPAKKDKVVKIGTAPDKRYDPPQLAKQLYPLGRGAAPCMCGILIRMQALKKIGCFESSFTGNDQLYEDQAFAIKMHLHLVQYISSGCNNIYRQRPDSLMHGIISNKKYACNRYFFLKWLKNYLREKQINDVKVETLLWKAFVAYKYPTAYKNVTRWIWKYRQSTSPNLTVVNE